nr:amidase family protein [Algoriphagus sp.]
MKKSTTLFVFLLLLLFSACSPEKKKTILDLEQLTVESIQEKYASGELTAESLVNAYMDRIDSINPKINALTIVNPNAIEIAKALDEEYRKTGVLRPLHGIPMIVKDNINTIGMPTTAGSWRWQIFILKLMHLLFKS